MDTKTIYQRAVAKGVIDTNTTLIDFMHDLELNYYVVRNVAATMFADDINGMPDEMVSASVELVSTIIKMLAHNGIDLNVELKNYHAIT